MINWQKTKIGAENFKGEGIKFLYGENDPSYRFVELIDAIENKACGYELIKGEGHNISIGSLESLIRNFITTHENLKI